MIILAAAIILSLSNSGIISKANKAKTDSDTANLKEYVNTLRAEWELMTDAERTASGSATFEEYANEKLEKNGYGVKLLEDGTFIRIDEIEEKYTASEVVEAGIKVGDVIKGYTVIPTTYITDGSEKSYLGTADASKVQTITTNTDITWKYMGIKNGKVEIVADLSSTVEVANNAQIMLGNAGGYSNGPSTLNKACEVLYSVDGVGKARSMSMDDVNAMINHENESLLYNTLNSYWLANSDFVELKLGTGTYYVKRVGADAVIDEKIGDTGTSEYMRTFAIRPIVELNESVKFSKDKTSENTWKISK